MNADRRRELRQARRQRRTDGTGPSPNPTAARTAAPPAAATAPPVDGPPPPGARRRTSITTDASRLAEKVRRRQQEKNKSTQVLSEREAIIQSRYAPRAADFVQQQEGSSSSGGTRTWTAAEIQAMADFEKDELLSALITDKRANFLKLDHELSEDHKLATQRLHTSVFSHANSFLLLFRDVDKASGLVEALKANVQGTKAAISAISKFTYANVGNVFKDANGGTADGTQSSVFGGVGGSSVLSRTRPSLVSRRHARLSTLTSGDGSTGVMLKSRGGGLDDQAKPSTNSGGSGGSSSLAASGDAVTASRATTRSLNVVSVLQWKHLIGRDGGAPGTASQAAAAAGTGTVAAAAPDAEKEIHDVIMFADIIKEEVNQLLSERRVLDAAELLQGFTEEATAKGCLPLLLELESAVVHAVLRSLTFVPATPTYMESIHIPLIQLLLRFGRWKNGTTAYLGLQAVWLRNELHKLQSRMNPRHASLITVDFLVNAVKDIIDRQHTLWMGLEEARRVLVEKRPERYKAMGEKEAGSKASATTSTNKRVLVKRSAPVEPGGAAPETAEAKKNVVLPANSAALLWVRDSVAHFAREVLSTQVLTYSTGTDGGDPTRVRRAVTTVIENIHALRGLTREGFGGVDTLTLRQLTPSLVILQTEYTQRTESRLENAGRAMVEKLITSCIHNYEAASKSYAPSASEDVARKNNLRSQELLKSLKSLPRCSHTWIIQLLLCPAAASMFERGAGIVLPGALMGASMSMRSAAGSITSSIPSLLPPEQYRFLRYANGCSTAHDLLVRSLLTFTAATTGSTWTGGAGSSGREGGGATTVGGAGASAPQSPGAVREPEGGHFLLTNAVFTESLDVAIYNLCMGFLSTTLKGRQAVVNFLLSEKFTTFHKKEIAGAGATSAAACPHLISSPQRSPSWVLDGLSGLLADVLSVSVWVSYFAIGGAAAHVMGDTTRAFRSRHLESLRRALPAVVQGWLSTTLALAHDVSHARGLAKQQTPLPEPGSSSPPTATKKTLQRMNSFPRLMRQDSAPMMKRPPTLTRQDSFPRLMRHQTTIPTNNRAGSPANNYSSSPTAQSPSGPAPTAIITTAVTPPQQAIVPTGGPVTVSVALYDKDGGPSDTPPPPAANSSKSSVSPLMAAFLREAEVSDAKMLPLLMSFLDTKFSTPAGYRLPALLSSMGVAVGFNSSTASQQPAPPAASVASPPSSSAPVPLVWGVRETIRSYPDFPIGAEFDRKDELFLFHWCVQMSLQLLTHFQERLLVPSYVVNSKAAAAPYPVPGCVSPLEDSPLGALCTGGGNYVAATSLLQFLVVRLLRDVICRPAIWSALYGCKSTADWRSDERVLRQQLFFFALYMRFWSPLFTGGLNTPVVQPDEKAAAAVRGNKAPPVLAIVSSISSDGVPALALLEWLAAGGILTPAAEVIAVATANATPQQPTAPGGGGGGTMLDEFFSGAYGGGAVAARGGGPNPGQTQHVKESWKQQQPVRNMATPQGPSVRVLSGISYVPDTLLRVVQQFFEDQLGETRAIAAITSEAMRTRVDRAMTTINLRDFVGTSLRPARGEEDSSDDEEDEEETFSASSKGKGGASEPVTMNRLRELLIIYVRPLL